MGSKGLSLPKTSPQALSEDTETLAIPSGATRGFLTKDRLLPTICWAYALVAFVVAAIIRFAVTGESLWVDELHSSWVVDGSFWQVAPRATIGNQSPLYFWLIWLIVKMIGMSEFSLRLLSMLTGLLLFIACAWSTWSWTRSSLAVIAVSSILAIDPIMVFYATEARPYALVQILGLFQILVFWKYWQSEIDERRQFSIFITASLIVISALLFYVHYTSILLFLAEATFVIANLLTGLVLKLVATQSGAASSLARVRWTAVSLRLIPVVLAGGVLALPAFSSLSDIWERKNNWLSVSSIEQLWVEHVPSWLILIFLPLLAVIVYSLFKRTNPKADLPSQKSLLILLATCAIGPAVFAIAADYYQLAPLALSRYVVVGMVAMILFVGVVIGRFQTKTERFLFTVLILGLLVWQNPIAQQVFANGKLPRFRHENWQESIAQINQRIEDCQLPVFQFANILEDVDSHTNLDLELQDYLLFPVRGLYKVEETDRQIFAMPSLAEKPFSESHLKLARGQRGAWLLIRATRNHANQIVASFASAVESKIKIDEFSSPDSDVILVLVTIQ